MFFSSYQEIMNNEEKLRKIISAYTPLEYTEIDLKEEIENKYISTEFNFNFSDDICQVWRNINSTQLKNDMFITLKTGEDILKIINYVNS